MIEREELLEQPARLERWALRGRILGVRRRDEQLIAQSGFDIMTATQPAAARELALTIDSYEGEWKRSSGWLRQMIGRLCSVGTTRRWLHDGADF